MEGAMGLLWVPGILWGCSMGLRGPVSPIGPVSPVGPLSPMGAVGPAVALPHIKGELPHGRGGDITGRGDDITGRGRGFRVGLGSGVGRPHRGSAP